MDYCYKSKNMFTESQQTIVESTPSQRSWLQSVMEAKFSGSKEELHLRELLVRASYQCECVGDLCKNHDGRCQTLHVAKGGDSPLLIQPRDFKKPHSMENDQVMCAPCANACTLTKMSVPKKKRKRQENPDQQTII